MYRYIYILVGGSHFMPPQQRGEELQKIIKSIRDGTFEYESKEPVTTNLAQYDQAQIHEMAKYLDNIRDLVEEADKRIKERTPPRKRRPGRMRSTGGGCHATWCWRGFGGVVDSSLVLTASGFRYPENQSFEQTPRNVTAPPSRVMLIPITREGYIPTTGM